MADLRTTDECRLGIVNEATLYMLAALRKLAAPLGFEAVFITAGTNGQHSGPEDPHYKGNALDIRTHNFPTRVARFDFAEALGTELGRQFFAFVEDPDSANEHIHVQVAKGKVWPPVPINVSARKV